MNPGGNTRGRPSGMAGPRAPKDIVADIVAGDGSQECRMGAARMAARRAAKKTAAKKRGQQREGRAEWGDIPTGQSGRCRFPHPPASRLHSLHRQLLTSKLPSPNRASRQVQPCSPRHHRGEVGEEPSMARPGATTTRHAAALQPVLRQTITITEDITTMVPSLIQRR